MNKAFRTIAILALANDDSIVNSGIKQVDPHGHEHDIVIYTANGYYERLNLGSKEDPRERLAKYATEYWGEDFDDNDMPRTDADIIQIYFCQSMYRYKYVEKE